MKAPRQRPLYRSRRAWRICSYIDWSKNTSRTFSLKCTEYILTHINPNIIIHRISGDAPKDLLVAPSWNVHKKWILNGLDKLMKENNYIYLKWILHL